MSVFSCSKPEKKCNCRSNFGQAEVVDMGHCDGTIPAQSDMEIAYGYTKTCY